MFVELKLTYETNNTYHLLEEENMSINLDKISIFKKGKYNNKLIIIIDSKEYTTEDYTYVEFKALFKALERNEIIDNILT